MSYGIAYGKTSDFLLRISGCERYALARKMDLHKVLSGSQYLHGPDRNYLSDGAQVGAAGVIMGGGSANLIRGVGGNDALLGRAGDMQAGTRDDYRVQSSRSQLVAFATANDPTLLDEVRVWAV